MSDAGTRLPPGNPAAFDYDSIDVGYYDAIYRRRAGIQSKWHHLKFAHVRRHFRPGQHHLDIGCGPGTFIGSLDPSIESIGIDIAAPQIRYAEEHYAAPHRRFELVEDGPLPFASRSFDVVTCIEMVEHLPIDAVLRLFTEAKRVLKPGGILLVTTPDYGGLWPAVEWALNRLSHVSYEHQHITRFTPARLSSLLEQAGLENNRVERFQFLAPFAACLGWGTADRIARLESRFLSTHLGLLLLGVSRAPDHG